MVISLNRFTVAPPQVSDAVGAVNTGVAGHWMVSLAPAWPIDGAVVSITIMVWLTFPDEFPQASTACQVTVLL